MRNKHHLRPDGGTLAPDQLVGGRYRVIRGLKSALLYLALCVLGQQKHHLASSTCVRCSEKGGSSCIKCWLPPV